MQQRSLISTEKQVALNNALIEAVEISNNLKVILGLIAQGADVHCQDAEGSTPLFKAIKYGYTEYFDALIQENVDIGFEGGPDKTSLLIEPVCSGRDESMWKSEGDSMSPAEEKIIHLIHQFSKETVFGDHALCRRVIDLISALPFGSASTVFIHHEMLKTFIENKIYSSEKEYFLLWLAIENYLSTNENPDLSSEKLNFVEEKLNECLTFVTPERIARGTYLPPDQLSNAQFIRNLYLTEDEKLIRLFLNYLPMPRPNIFEGLVLPEIVAKRERASTQTIQKLLAKNENNLSDLERKIIPIQRRFRAKRRQREELGRIDYNYRLNYLFGDTVIPEELVNDANSPYLPKCESRLAQRIMCSSSNLI